MSKRLLNWQLNLLLCSTIGLNSRFMLFGLHVQVLGLLTIVIYTSYCLLLSFRWTYIYIYFDDSVGNKEG